MTRRVVLLAIAIQSTVLLWVAGRFVYLRLLLSNSLGVAAKILWYGGGITLVVLAAYLMWIIARRNRFRLRSMLIGVAIFGGLLAVLVPQLPKSEHAAAVNRALVVLIAHRGKQSTAQNDPDWKTVQVNSAALTDEELAFLTSLQDTVDLDLAYCNASANGWKQITRFRSLGLFNIQGTNIDDDSLSEIRAVLPMCAIRGPM
jgi:hypothetical protein